MSASAMNGSTAEPARSFQTPQSSNVGPQPTSTSMSTTIDDRSSNLQPTNGPFTLSSDLPSGPFFQSDSTLPKQPPPLSNGQHQVNAQPPPEFWTAFASLGAAANTGGNGGNDSLSQVPVNAVQLPFIPPPNQAGPSFTHEEQEQNIDPHGAPGSRGRSSPSATAPGSPKSSNGASVPLDPSAPAFLAEMLGPAKWATFSAKLFERRLGGPKSRELKKKRQKELEKVPLTQKQKGKSNANNDDDDEVGTSHGGEQLALIAPAGTSLTGRSSHGATVIEFLVKTEVVKEVLRTYVPHPYNPLKSLAHPWPGSPSGTVVLTRPAVLKLCGWSNTQFSYWARRSEAIACLSQHDERLQKVRSVLEARMARGEWMVNTTNEEADLQSAAVLATMGINPSAVEDVITGKGLDAVIDQVKKRTGASQFIRGKHASLDPFGTVLGEDFAHGLGNPNLANRLPLPPGITIGMTAGFNVPGGIAVPALTGTGGGGGIRITDVRKRVAEAKARGEQVPDEWVRAEQAASTFAAAKMAGKGKRGPGRSKGLAGGDNHGTASAQDQLTAAAIIDGMQRGVFGEVNQNGQPLLQQALDQMAGGPSQAPGAGPSNPNFPSTLGFPRPVTEQPYDDAPDAPHQTAHQSALEPSGDGNRPLRRKQPARQAAQGRQLHTEPPELPTTLQHNPYDYHTLAHHAQAHAKDHTHPTHLPISFGQDQTQAANDVDGVMLDPAIANEAPATSSRSKPISTGMPTMPNPPNTLPQSLNAAFVASFTMDLPSMGLSLPIPTLPIVASTPDDDHYRESIIATSISALGGDGKEELSVLADVATNSNGQAAGDQQTDNATGSGSNPMSSELPKTDPSSQASGSRATAAGTPIQSDFGSTSQSVEATRSSPLNNPRSLNGPLSNPMISPRPEEGAIYFTSGSRLEESSERGVAVTERFAASSARKRHLDSTTHDSPSKRRRPSPAPPPIFQSDPAHRTTP